MSFLRAATGWAAAIHVASLDAPVVAVAWQDAFARLADVGVSPAERIVLFLSVWLAYSADRGLDVAWRPAAQIRTARHRFVRRHVGGLVAAWVLVFVASVVLAIHELPASALRSGWWLFVLVLAYLGAVQGIARSSARGFPKELAVAGLFATGTAWFVGVRVAADRPASFATFAVAVLAFASLAALNCLLISRVEYRDDRARGEVAWLSRRAMQRLVRGGTSCVIVLAIGTVVAAMLMAPDVAATNAYGGSRVAEFAMMVALSGGALHALDRAVRRVDGPRRAVRVGRAWADVCLWTPLPFMILRGIGG